jgi:nicotinate-nucleotide adenylyltransferase
MTDSSPVGILGGIFDPVHFGHLATARLALDYFHLKKIYLVPAGTPAHKPAPLAGPAQRLAMLSLSVENSKGLEVWDGEIRRPGASYTVDTLRELKLRHPEAPLYFIIGSDNLKEIPLWYDYRAILSLAIFCVTHRPSHSLRLPRELEGLKMKVFPGPEWNISSSMVRKYLARGYSCDFLLPAKVIASIRANGLYGGSAAINHRSPQNIP